MDALSIIFHELRTPISSIQGYASILLSGELGPLAQRQRDAVERLRELTRYTTSLMTNLRQLVQLAEEPSALSWERLDLERLIESVCRDLDSEAKRKGVRLTTHISSRLPLVWAERDGLTQVLFNLLVNAIKFTHPKGRVVIAASAPDRSIRLEFRDTGVGIDPETLPKLFQPFYHEDKPEVGAVGGTGLGLAIVKRIVERHDGSVEVTSRPGQGATFRVVLPRREGDEVVQEILERFVERAAQRHEPFTVLLLECRGTGDGRAGQQLYARLERVVQETIRREDRCLPWRRGEVLAVFAKTNLDGARLIVGRLTERLRKDEGLSRAPRLRLLLGLATFPTHGRTGTQLLTVARGRLEPLTVTTTPRRA